MLKNKRQNVTVLCIYSSRLLPFLIETTELVSAAVQEEATVQLQATIKSPKCFRYDDSAIHVGLGAVVCGSPQLGSPDFCDSQYASA